MKIMFLRASFIQIIFLVKIAFAPICKDKIVTSNNIYWDFNIYNLEAVGQIAISHEFREYLSNKYSPLYVLNGSVIYVEILHYILGRCFGPIYKDCYETLSSFINAGVWPQAQRVSCERIHSVRDIKLLPSLFQSGLLQ